MTRSADVLRLSGLVGLTLGIIIGNYQVMLRSPMMLGGSQAAPSWMVASHVHILGLSLIILFYSFFVDDLFERYAGVVAGAAIIGQWVEPLSIYPLEALQIGIFGLILQLAAILNLIVILAFLVGYARSGWGTAGT